MSAFCFDWYPVVVPLFFQDGYSSWLSFSQFIALVSKERPLTPGNGKNWLFQWWFQWENLLAMDQYLYIPFLGEWTSIYQLFWCSPGVQGFDPLPYLSPAFRFEAGGPRGNPPSWIGRPCGWFTWEPDRTGVTYGTYGDLNGARNNRGLISPIHRDGRVAENLWLILVEKMVGCPKKKKNTGVRTCYQHVTWFKIWDFYISAQVLAS